MFRKRNSRQREGTAMSNPEDCLGDETNSAKFFSHSREQKGPAGGAGPGEEKGPLCAPLPFLFKLMEGFQPVTEGSSDFLGIRQPRVSQER